MCRPFGELESLAYKNDSKVAWQECLKQPGPRGAAVPRPPSHVKPGTTVRNAGSLETISQVTWSIAWSSCIGLDQICFFFYPFCFSFLLKFSTYFAFYCTHFAFNYIHFASHDEVVLQKFAAPIPSAILVDLSSCCSHQQ